MKTACKRCILLFILLPLFTNAQFRDTLDIVEIKGVKLPAKKFSTYGKHKGGLLFNKEIGKNQRSSLHYQVAIKIENTKGKKLRIDSLTVRHRNFDTSCRIQVKLYTQGKLANSSLCQITGLNKKEFRTKPEHILVIPEGISYLALGVTRDKVGDKEFTIHTNREIPGYIYSLSYDDKFNIIETEGFNIGAPQLEVYYSYIVDE